MEKNKQTAIDKARRILTTLLERNPEYTGCLKLNFHRGDLSEKVKVEHELVLKTE